MIAPRIKQVVRETVDRAWLHKEIARRIRETRKLKNLTQSDVAERAGISRTLLINMEQGKQGFQIAHLYDISHVLGVPVTKLIP